jgi:4-hydroxybenzoate polyprenyltransferase
MTAAHLRDWARERFPPANGVFFVLLYALVLVVGRATVPGPIVLSWRDLPGLFALWLFFLWLRVLDEHKDFENDRVAHPGRVLQRGLVTLRDLKVVGAATLVIQLAVSLWMDGGVGPVTGWWLMALVWSSFMAKEFFVRDWLRRHIIWYALSHMIVMLALVVWVATMGAATAARSEATWVLAGLVYASGLAFEIGRKMRAPEDEHPLADSYTQSLGVVSATVLLSAVVAVVAVLCLVATGVVSNGIWLWVVLAATAGLVVVLGVLREFNARPTPRAAKRVEAGVGLSILAMHTALLAAVIHARSLTWR